MPKDQPFGKDGSYLSIAFIAKIGISSTKIGKKRETVVDLVPPELSRKELFPVGRLDRNSEGLLIMTNDGDLANKLMHPAHHVPKTYNVRVEGSVTKEQLALLSSEMVIDDYKIKPVECKILRSKNGYTVLEMILHEGRNRQIRKMCEAAGLEISYLRRIAIGTIELGDLRSGQWRWLTKEQIKYLKEYK